LVEIWIGRHIIKNGEVFNELSNFLKQYGYTKKKLYEGKLRDFDLEFTNEEHVQDFFLSQNVKLVILNHFFSYCFYVRDNYIKPINRNGCWRSAEISEG
jgi:hypothetical protein